MFKDYNSKPIVSSAHKVLEEDSIVKVPDLISTYSLSASDGTHVIFKAYRVPDVGDYLVYFVSDKIQHYTAEKFENENIIPGDNT